MVSRSATHLMPHLVDTKRAPDVVAGKRGVPVAYLTAVPCTPLMPITAEVANRFPDMTPRELLQCFVPGNYDVKEGDVLVLDSHEYPVREAGEWTLRRHSYIHLVLEDEKIR